MSFDGRVIGNPPGQSTLRIEVDSDPLVITNLPTAEQLNARSATLGPIGAGGPAIARLGSCVTVVFAGIGWLFLAFGLLVIGAMAAAVFIFNQPFNLNGQPAGKDVAALFLGLFLGVWITICLLWIYFSRFAFRVPGLWDPKWRLVLNSEEWISYQAETNRVLGRCSCAEIDRLDRDSTGRVAAYLLDGTVANLTGALSGLDSGWLHESLTRALGRSVEHLEPVQPYIPSRDKYAVPGSTLAWRLNRADSPWGSALVAAFICLFWNGITGVFVGIAVWGDAQINWTMALIMIPFVLIGLVLVGLVFFCIYQAIVQSRIGDTALELEALPLPAGQQLQALVLQKGPLQLRRLSIRMVCDEEAQYRQGTSTRTDTKRVRELQVYEQFDLQIVGNEPLADSFDLSVPSDVMHSFKGAHNSITWKLIVRGEPESWPAYEREFPIVIHPPAIQEEE